MRSIWKVMYFWIHWICWGLQTGKALHHTYLPNLFYEFSNTSAPTSDPYFWHHCALISQHFSQRWAVTALAKTLTVYFGTNHSASAWHPSLGIEHMERVWSALLSAESIESLLWILMDEYIVKPQKRRFYLIWHDNSYRSTYLMMSSLLWNCTLPHLIWE